jgi:hypothetical protein
MITRRSPREFAAVFSLIRICLPWIAAVGLYAQGRKSVEAALEFFRGSDLLKLESVLEKVWTPPASADSVTAALKSFESSLPEGGEVKLLDAGERRKIATLRQVLSRGGRKQLEVKVISVPQAHVGLYKRSIILVSQSALQLLNAEELQAMVAHEAGHDLMWAKWEAARAVNDRASLHQLELFCDGLAIVAMHSVQADLSRWVSGLEKFATYNRRRFGEAATDRDRHPPVSDRKRFAEMLIRRIRELEKTNREGRKG